MMIEFLELPWWGYVVYTLVLTHITIVSVTLFLHRSQAHRAVDLHPLMSHFFRFWLWLTTGMETKHWVAVHRKHHAKVETAEDPHSPHVYGIKKVMLEGAELYRAEAIKQETLDKYGHGTPDDWLERHVYGRHVYGGIALMALINIALFGGIGLVIWAVQMAWIPFWAAGVINGLGHWWGYRNYEPKDGSTNLVPLGILIGGEEMHNNHHAFPSSAKFSSKWWELDIGWLYLRLMQGIGLARVRRMAPQPVIVKGKDCVDLDTVRAVVVGRLHVMAHYASHVMLPVLQQELAKADASCKALLKRASRLLVKEESRMDRKAQDRLARVLDGAHNLRVVYEYRRKLQAVWDRTHSSQEKLVSALQEWCAQAEATGVRVLQEFAQNLRGYTLKPI